MNKIEVLILDLQKENGNQAKLVVVAKGRKIRTSLHLISSTPSRLAQLTSEASISRSWKLRSRRNAAVGLFCIDCTTSLIWGALTVARAACTSSTARLKDSKNKRNN